MRQRSTAVILSLMIAAAAAGPALADDAKRLALARQIMAQVHEDDALRAGLPLLGAEMRQSLARQGMGSADAEAFVARYQKRLADEIGRYGDMMAEAYAQAFTEDELSAVIAFNATPVGQKFIAKRPELTQASVLTMQRLRQEVGREVAEDIEREKAKSTPPRKM